MVGIRPITPGDVAFETLSLLDTLAEATVVETDAGVSSVDLFLGSGALAGVAMTIGGMPFFSAVLEGVLTGAITTVLGEDGRPDGEANSVGDLALDIDLSPIFTVLGGDFYDALFAATSVPSVDPGGAPDTPLAVPVATHPGPLGASDPAFFVAAEALAESEATAFGDGRFFLDIAGLLDGLVVAQDENDPLPDLVAQIFGEFSGEALIDIREGLDVASSGFIDTYADVFTSPAPLVSSADPLGTVITDDAVAMAA
jgi:hypothetical protein